MAGDDNSMFESMASPDAFPQASEHILSVVCGNSRTKFFFYSSERNDTCNTLWVIENPGPDQLREHPMTQLHNSLASEVKQVLFGTPDINGLQSVVPKQVNRRFPVLRVYISSSNMESARVIAKIFKGMLSRVFLLKAEDFVGGSSKQLPYPGIGIDRVQAVRGASLLTKFPVLVIDGGTATTFTATDERGNILGGGISAGLKSKLDALHEHTSALPRLNVREISGMVVDEKGTFDLFGKNTKDAMIGAVLMETRAYLQNVIDLWTERARKLIPTASSSDDYNRSLKVVLTGGDADLFLSLLSTRPDALPRLVDAGAGQSVNSSTPVKKLVVHKYAQHAGLISLLEKKLNKKMSTHDQIREAVLGQRVALRERAHNGSRTTKGVVGRCIRAAKLSQDKYVVHMDNLSTSNISVEQLIGGLSLFQGEGSSLSKTQAARDALKVLQEALAKEPGYSASNKARKPPPPAAAAASQPSPKKPTPNVTAVHKEFAIAKTLFPGSPSLATNGPSNGQKRTSPPNSAPKPAPKKIKRPPSVEQPKVENVLENPSSFLGRRVAKYFEEDLYYGSVTEYIDGSQVEGGVGVWSILYDDGDGEDFEAADLKAGLVLFKRHQKKDPRLLK